MLDSLDNSQYLKCDIFEWVSTTVYVRMGQAAL